jgi:L-lactate permease
MPWQHVYDPLGWPADAAVAAACHGAAFGLFPIGWIIVAAMFLYRLTVAAGALDVMKRSVTSLSADHRLQALLIAFSFGAFLEGAAGFGAPVAISAALLVGAGARGRRRRRGGSTGSLAAAILAIPWLGIQWRTAWSIWWETLRGLSTSRWPRSRRCWPWPS